MDNELVGKLLFLIVGSIIGFSSGEIRESLKERRRRQQSRRLVNLEAGTLMEEAQRLLQELEKTKKDRIGRCPAEQLFHWGGERTQGLLRFILSSYNNDRQRLVVLKEKDDSKNLFDLFLFVDDLLPRLELNWRRIVEEKVHTAPQVCAEDFEELCRRCRAVIRLK